MAGKVTVGLASHWPCYRLSGIPTYGLNGLRNGDEHSAYDPVEYGTFTFTLLQWWDDAQYLNASVILIMAFYANSIP